MATIMLDAGHGGYDSGAVYEGRLEKEDTLKLVLATGQQLENDGINVLYTRTEDIYQSPGEKAGIANRSDADYFISIHRNSSPTPDTYAGVETLVYRDGGIPALFGENINEALANVGFQNLGIKERPGLAVLKGTTMPAALVEVGFLNTPSDNELLDKNFDAVVAAIAGGIRLTIQGAAVTPDTITAEDGAVTASATVSPPSPVEINPYHYQVELGIFRHRKNAESLADALQKDGFACYILSRGETFHVCHGAFDTIEEAQGMEQKLFAAGYETRVVYTTHKVTAYSLP